MTLITITKVAIDMVFYVCKSDKNDISWVSHILLEVGALKPIELPHNVNTQRWQFWHFCRASNGNKCQIAKNRLIIKTLAFVLALFLQIEVTGFYI